MHDIRSRLPTNITINQKISVFSVENIVSNNTNDIVKFLKELFNCKDDYSQHAQRNAKGRVRF